jgi:hypothetical protein
MKFALLVYGARETFGGASRAIHDPAAYLTLDTGTARLLAHYRLRAPERTTTIRLSGNDPTRSTGPATEHHETLSAFFLIESEQEETVLEIASQLPAVRLGATVEVWPLIETAGNHEHRPESRHPTLHEPPPAFSDLRQRTQHAYTLALAHQTPPRTEDI